ncbi:MAG: T9SS type A sorting domain-containing protein [Rhodothermales bacterium]|nr:T9SS type A sorting domain-containing protein [Rhodothermales bacterium]
MPHLRVLLLSLGLCLPVAPSGHAQTHFTGCLDGAGNVFNATVVVPAGSAPEVGGVPLAAGAEIAVFSSDPLLPEICAGVLVWQGEHGYITVWGTHDRAPERDGLRAGEALRYRVWDPRAGVEYGGAAVRAHYAQGSGLYTNDAVMILSTLEVTPQDAGVAAEAEAEVPASAQLYANYPNPFARATTLAFGLPRAAHVTLAVYDLLGKRVATPFSAPVPAGRHAVYWDAGDLPSGVYLYRMQAGATVLRRELTIVK